MNMKGLIPILGIIIFLYLAVFSHGAELSIGIRAGYAVPSEVNYDSGFAYGINFCLEITKNIAFELSGLRFQSNVEEDPAALSKGKLSVLPIQLSMQARFPIGDKFVPYVLGGGGYYLNSFTIDKQIADNWNELSFDIEEKAKNALGFQFGAGIDYFLNQNIALNADFRYCIAKFKGTWSLTDQVSGTVVSGNIENLNLNTIILGAGLKFYF